MVLDNALFGKDKKTFPEIQAIKYGQHLINIVTKEMRF